MADTFRRNFDDDVYGHVNARRNNRRKSKARLKTFSYNKEEDKKDYSNVSTEWDDEDNFEKFNKRK